MNRVSIRDAVSTDLPAIVRIYNSSIAGRMATADTEPVSLESRERWFAEHEPVRRPLWVAEVEAGIVGWLSFQSFYGRPAYHATAELSVYVSPERHRRGVAGTLLARAVDQAPALGLRTLLGFIFGHNEPSLRLFERFEFERWGLLPGVAELDGVARDVIIMGRRLDGR